MDFHNRKFFRNECRPFCREQERFAFRLGRTSERGRSPGWSPTKGGNGLIFSPAKLTKNQNYSDEREGLEVVRAALASTWAKRLTRGEVPGLSVGRGTVINGPFDMRCWGF